MTLSAATRTRTRAARVLTTLGLLAGALGVGVVVAGPASAHHPTIKAATDCSGTVAWTSTAWDGNVGKSDHEAPRTNDQVQISYRLDDASDWTSVTEGAYNKGDDFSFGGKRRPEQAASPDHRAQGLHRGRLGQRRVRRPDREHRRTSVR